MIHHLISAKQFTTSKRLDNLFTNTDSVTDRFQAPFCSCNGKVMASVFLEPSLRTRTSFESAMVRLGGHVITHTNSKEFSSSAKGESFEDTIKTLSELVDVIVLRHPTEGSALRATEVAKVPIINAGDGGNEHPTQAMLDMYTIHKKFKLEGLTVTLCGDLRYGRTVHSLVRLLSLYPGMHIQLVSPPELHLPKKLVEDLSGKVKFTYYEKLEKALSTDVLYMTRLQKERFSGSLLNSALSPLPINLDDYSLTMKLLHRLGEDSIVMHPLPKNQEVEAECDSDPRCIYFNKQIKNGMKVRMGLLYSLFHDKICWDSI